MHSFSARRALSACVLSAAVVAALAVPGAASAAEHCSGENIKGQGASTQTTFQQTFWDPDFNTSGDPTACSGAKKPTISYTQSGSGAGLEAWGFKGHAFEMGTWAFLGTDEPLDSAGKGEVEANEKAKIAETVQTVPVAQVAIAIMINLPANCVATSTPAKNRLSLSNPTLESIYRGKITTWKALVEAESKNKSGDAITGTGCNTSTPITPYVRTDDSGTTHIFKKYLALINKETFPIEGGGTSKWSELAEGPGNQLWPAGVVTKGGEGGGALVTTVAGSPSSIGYASLRDVRKNGGFSKTGGPGTSKFWAEIENNGTGTKGIKAADPASNGDEEKTGNANCSKVKYTNGSGTKFPPKTTAATWNEVTTETKQAKGIYPICGLTYDLVVSKYSDYPGTTEKEATTAHDFLQFVLSTGAEGGQALALNADIEPLPKKLIKEAQKGAALAGF
jgi:ABC-type phosphate transport system substrate-binding protein